MSIPDIELAVMSLKIHRSLLNERHLYLGMLALLPVIYSLFTEPVLKTVLTIIVVLLVLLERNTCIEHLSIYDEIIIALENYINNQTKFRGHNTYGGN